MKHINYEQKEMVLEIDGGHNEIMVLELNAQCVIMDKNTRRFRLTFPKTWNKFVQLCINSQFDLGGVSMFTEDGVNIAILNNVYFRIGSNKDDVETVRQMTLDSIKKMVKIVGKDKQFVSGYIGDAFSKDIWGSIVGYIKRENLTWSVYRD